MNLQQQNSLTAARSLHPGGLAVLLCDGGVRFASESLDQRPCCAMATRQEDELLKSQ